MIGGKSFAILRVDLYLNLYLNLNLDLNQHPAHITIP
mgnify:CR=1 FL=1